MISVVIPLYNKEHQICNAIQSVLNQVYTDFELIVVNDGSTDGSRSKVEGINDERITIIDQANGGVSRARNLGIKHAKGEYVAFLDADDEWLPDYLLTQQKLINQYPECNLFATDYVFRLTNGKERNTIIRKLPFSETDGILTNYFEVSAVSHPPLWTSAVVVSKKALDSVGGFPAGIASGEDLLTWARLACKYQIAYTNKKCAVYNLGEGYDYTKTPPRRQDYGDPVGKGLKALLMNHKELKGLRSYVARWHKMRASVALRYFERTETLKEALLSLRYDLFKTETYPFLILPLLPSCMIRSILKRKNSN